MQTELTVTLPLWLIELTDRVGEAFPTQQDRMRFVIGLARENVQRRTGGPFGAGVFDADGRLVAPGVNLVVAANCSLLHAEMVAIAFAQKELGRYDLAGPEGARHELAASSEPCSMCFGAIPWSGLTHLVCGTREADARAIGFDEGPKPPDWQQALEQRGIHVSRDVLRPEAVEVLNLYAKSGGEIYNPGPGPRWLRS